MTSGPRRRSAWRATAKEPVSKVANTAAVGPPQTSSLESGSWQRVEGDDVLNERVLEMHRLGQSLSLLGQGTPEGFVDHEFPPGSESVDGVEAPEVKKGQQLVIDLLAAARATGPENAVDDDADEPPKEAPRCFCHKRARQNRVRVPAEAVFRRPYYRCAGQNCRFLSLGELGPAPRASDLPWIRYRTGPHVNEHLVVVGCEGYRPEDARFGPEADISGTSFVDALAVLAERPELVAQLLPNAHEGGGGPSGCHEVRLCVDGHWRAILVDERFPTRCSHVSSSSSSTSACGRFPDQELAFGRNAGNQIWLPLIEKAYAKALGAYDFALPGMLLSEVLTDLTGAPVESKELSETSSTGASGETTESLWRWLRGLSDSGALIACNARWQSRSTGRSIGSTAGQGRVAVHALLGLAEPGDPSLLCVGLGAHRAVRLRNPRTGFHAASKHQDALLALRGVPAEGSTHGDGSFWVQFPNDFCAGFARVDACHAALAGGEMKHCRSFEGETTPEKGLGVRGCGLRLRVGEDADSVANLVSCWLTVMQSTPKGARLLRPAMGRVMNDLGLVVLDTAGAVQALAMGGAWRDTVCRLDLKPGREYFALPLSFRAWPGGVTLRVHAASPVDVQAIAASEYEKATWSGILALATMPEMTSAIQGGPRGARRIERDLPLTGERKGDAAKMLVLELEGAAIVVVRNPHDVCSVLVECELEASHMAVHTARGPQFGTWLRERNEAAALEMHGWGPSQPDWRGFLVEDVVPPRSQQLLCVMFSVAHRGWKMEVRSARASPMPRDAVGPRPAGHPFCPHRFGEASGSPRSSAAADIEDEDEMLRLALQLSLSDSRDARRDVEGAAPAARDLVGADLAEPIGEGVSNGQARGRWARRARPKPCSICGEAMVEPAPLSCCSSHVCMACARHWARVQVQEQGAATVDVQCPSCAAVVDSSLLPDLLGASVLKLARLRAREREEASQRAPPSAKDIGIPDSVLEQLRTKRCPTCGTGVQKESETCHKMICRTCRTKFCFRCLHRLEYFNCGCTGAEHRFIDPISGEVVAH